MNERPENFDGCPECGFFHMAGVACPVEPQPTGGERELPTFAEPVDDMKRRLRAIWDAAFAKLETRHGGADDAWGVVAHNVLVWMQGSHAIGAASECQFCKLSPEMQKLLLDFYDRHAVTPEEVRYLMAYRRLGPEEQQQVRERADLLLAVEAERARRRRASSPPPSEQLPTEGQHL